jgi:tripartite-type tricarboxylate transporter receptor subunit TctC
MGIARARKARVQAQLTAPTPPETLPFASEPRGNEAAAWGRTRDGFMSIGSCFRPVAAAAACLLIATSTAAAQDSVEQFYKGRQISLVVGSSAGGGYDTYARLLARHFGETLPGRPTIVVQNMSGAGSNRAAGFIYSVAPKDGSAIGAIFPGAVLQPLLSDAPVPHDPSKLVYLGSANSDVYVCYVRADAPVKSYQDTLSHELIIGASNPGATTYDLALLLNNVVGTKFRIVTGYPGSREITLALERGEVQGACGIGWTGIETMHPNWFATGMIKPLVQLSNDGHADLNKRGVPRAVELARNDEDRRVIELVFSQGIFGRPFVLPPEVPADRLAALRKGFMAAMGSEGLRAEAVKMNLDIEPIPGDDLQTLIAGLCATPAHVVERARQALTAKPQR